jgi:hypothetical protein
MKVSISEQVLLHPKTFEQLMLIDGTLEDYGIVNNAKIYLVSGPRNVQRHFDTAIHLRLGVVFLCLYFWMFIVLSVVFKKDTVMLIVSGGRKEDDLKPAVVVVLKVLAQVIQCAGTSAKAGFGAMLMY